VDDRGVVIVVLLSTGRRCNMRGSWWCKWVC